MALTPGTKLGQYEIRALIGAGGMGEVYRAHDTKLDRDVAIKVLPEAFARDPERVARFRREAKLLASLNHPNIATIHGLEEADGAHFLVMELVEGETLAELLNQGPERQRRVTLSGEAEPLPGGRGSDSGLAIEDALAITTQICDALEHAHERGVIHRDLKPANVKLTSDGNVKVLDFGLAKAFAGDGTAGDSPKPVYDSNSPTVSRLPAQLSPEFSPTIPGTIMGTAAYMSPEQARGKVVDKRTDIWALGCVLYELLTGEGAFYRSDPCRDREQADTFPRAKGPLPHGRGSDGAIADAQPDTVQDILARVLKSEPDWTALPAATPPGIRTLLRRCLDKDRARRYHDAADVRIQIEESLASAALPAPASAAVQAQPTWRRALPWATAALLSLLVGAAAWTLKPAPPTAPGLVSRFVITLPAGESLEEGWGLSPLALSPDGTQFVYSATVGGHQQFHLRSMGSLESKPIPGTEAANINPFFSPDGQWLGFAAGGALKKISISGGEPVTLCDCVPNLRGAAWGPNNTIVFAPSTTSAIWQVSASGGTPQVLTTLDSANGEESHRWPELLPGGNALLFTVGREGGWADAEIVVQRLDTSERRVLVRGGTYAHYLPTGHLVYLRQGSLMAIPFDLARLDVSGTAVPVLEGISQNPSSGAPRMSISSNGSLAYLPATFGENLDAATLVWVDRKGIVQPLKAPPHPYLFARLSPDGRRVAVGISAPNSNIWVFDNSGESLTRLTFEGSNAFSVWAAGGSRILYGSHRAGPRNLFWKASDGSGVEERLTTSRHSQNATSTSPDGKLLTLTELDPDTGGGDIWVLPLEGDRKPQPFLKTPAFEGGATFSPDGRWLAYTSNESGNYEVYVQPFPATGAKWQVSSGGGSLPVWARNGRELFFLDNNQRKLLATEISTQPAFSASKPRELFEFQRVTGIAPPSYAIYDVSPDGERFLVAQHNEPPPEPTPIHVVLNWFEELKQKVPVK
jgi:eukaryotic-like serine/threonine-protein kinase